MKTAWPYSPHRMFWQTVVAVLLGIWTGITILIVTHKRPAVALTKTNAAAGAYQERLNFVANLQTLQILPKLTEKMTVLVMGVDSNGPKAERFVGVRSDSMMLASFDPYAHKVGLVSIPRDSKVKIANSNKVDKVNAAYAYGGPTLAVATISEAFAVPINHYIVVDTQGLKHLCELLGPLPVLVEKEMHYRDRAAHLDINLKPGQQYLNAAEAEEYLRFRHDCRGDIGRIERQQWFLRQCLHRLAEPAVFLKLPELLKLAYDFIQTDLSIEELTSIAAFVKDIRSEEVLTTTLPGQAQLAAGVSYWVVDPERSQFALNRVLGNSDTSYYANRNAELASSSKPDRSLVVALRYPKGIEEKIARLQDRLTKCGYQVKYKWPVAVSDCKHEQILLTSTKVDEEDLTELRNKFPVLATWPATLSLDGNVAADFTLNVPADTDVVPLPAVSSSLKANTLLQISQ